MGKICFYYNVCAVILVYLMKIVVSHCFDLSTLTLVFFLLLYRVVQLLKVSFDQIGLKMKTTKEPLRKK
jgi:hypothetical protein